MKKKLKKTSINHDYKKKPRMRIPTILSMKSPPTVKQKKAAPLSKLYSIKQRFSVMKQFHKLRLIHQINRTLKV